MFDDLIVDFRWQAIQFFAGGFSEDDRIYAIYFFFERRER